MRQTTTGKNSDKNSTKSGASNQTTQKAAKTARTKQDARVIKTLAGIETAFLDLLRQKPYDDITIGDVLERADINRTTFYKYYKNKNDLARTMVDGIADDFMTPMLDKRFGMSWEEFSQALPELFDKNLSKLQALWRINTHHTNLKADLYTLIKARYIKEMQEKDIVSGRDDLTLQGHLYASFAIAMLEYTMQLGHLNEPNTTQYNIKQVFNHLILR